MSLIPFTPLYLGCARSARPLPRGFIGRVAHPIRSIFISYFLSTAKIQKYILRAQQPGIALQ
jgi:hypothetical protein